MRVAGTLFVILTFLDFCNNPIHGCSSCCCRSLGLSAFLVGPVLLLLLTRTGGQVRAVFSATASSLLSSTTVAHRLTPGHTTTAAAGHLQALGTDRPPVARVTTTAGVWIWGVPLPAWPGYLGDDAGLNSPRTESGRLVRDGDLKHRQFTVSYHDVQFTRCNRISNSYGTWVGHTHQQTHAHIQRQGPAVEQVSDNSNAEKEHDYCALQQKAYGWA